MGFAQVIVDQRVVGEARPASGGGIEPIFPMSSEEPTASATSASRELKCLSKPPTVRPAFFIRSAMPIPVSPSSRNFFDAMATMPQ